MLFILLLLTSMSCFAEEDLQTARKAFFEKIKNENLYEAEQFLKALSREDHIVELEPRKLYYKVLKKGTGPKVEECPVLLYKAKVLENGQEEVLHQIEEAKPILLSSTIDGFFRGVKGMQEGEIRAIYIHPDLGFGSSSDVIAPNTLMIFEVEIIKSCAYAQQTDEMVTF